MTSVKWDAGDYSSVATTTLNSLANNGQAISDEIDNSWDLYLFDDVELHTETFGSAPSSGAVVELYAILADLDGTGYEDGESVVPPASNLVGVFNIRAVTNAQTHVLRHVPIPPSKFKYAVINKTGQAFAASGNTLRRRPYSYQSG
jgi:hypothetical protein